MGHQFSCYLTANDESQVMAELQRSFGALFFRTLFYDESEMQVTSLSELGKYLTDTRLGFTNADFRKQLVVTTYAIGHKRINLGEAPSIEFSRTEWKGNKVRCGRFWYQLSSLDGPKPDSFKKWSASVFRFLKANLVKLAEPYPKFLGTEASTIFAQGNIHYW